MMKDGRRHPRVILATEIWLGQDGVFTRTDEQLCILSIAGAFIASRHSQAQESLLNLRFKLSQTGDFITCTGMVRAVYQGRGIGVEFVELSADDRERIRAFIAQQLLSEALRRTAIGQTGRRREGEKSSGSGAAVTLDVGTLVRACA
jgi:hypothetical protein